MSRAAPLRTVPTPQHHVVQCERHGEQVWRQHTYGEAFDGRCPVCRDEEARAAEEAQRRRWRIEELQDELNLPSRFCTADLDDFVCTRDDQRAVVKACKAFVQDAFDHDDGRGLLLLGPPGTGKTWLASAVLNAWVETHAQSAAMVTQRGLIRELRDTWRKGAATTEDEVIRKYGKVRLLLLDDAGIGLGGEAEMVQLLDVIDMRYADGLSTVVTSNLKAAQLAQVLGDRTAGRLREKAAEAICNWPSFRGGRGDA